MAGVTSAADFKREATMDPSDRANPDSKALYKEIALFEYQLAEASYIADLVEQNVFIPPGFNQNAIELIKFKGLDGKDALDLAAIIASALSSNLYLNGLAHLDYLSMPANTKPFNGKFRSKEA